MKPQMELHREDLLHNRQKEVIVEIINDLQRDDEDLYYSPTIEIAELVYEYINSDEMPIESKDIVRDLDRNDIQILMSIHS